jgi:hypothetical protein
VIPSDHSSKIDEFQQATCCQWNAIYLPVDWSLKAGVSANVGTGVLPLNGLRLAPEGGTCGWYIWAGEELSQEHDFFKPLCVQHLRERCPELLKFLGLPPGWRFLKAGDYEDVWCDEQLIARGLGREQQDG